MPMSLNEMDKLDAVVPIRAPKCLKDAIERDLGPVQRKAMNIELLEVMARHIHNSRFNPLDYLRTD